MSQPSSILEVLLTGMQDALNQAESLHRDGWRLGEDASEIHRDNVTHRADPIIGKMMQAIEIGRAIERADPSGT